MDQTQAHSSAAVRPAAPAPASSGTQQPAWPDAVIDKGSPWQPVVTAWITLGFLLLLAVLGLRRLKRVPDFLQNLWEFTFEWLEEITLQVVGPDGPWLLPYFFSVFVFILAANLLGLIPWLASPTARTSTTVALTACTFFMTHILGLKRKGFGYISHFFHIVDASKETSLFPKCIMFILQWVMLPVSEVIGELARPLSLSLRLFGNIFAKEILLMVLAALTLRFFDAGGKGWILMWMPLALRPGILVLGVLVSVIQAAVFVGLSMIYVGGALAEHGGHEEEGAHVSVQA